MPTWQSNSASFIAAAIPASPPPIIRIDGLDIVAVSFSLGKLIQTGNR
jgi:hypothetical protein